jgi:hypothetical protein
MDRGEIERLEREAALADEAERARNRELVAAARLMRVAAEVRGTALPEVPVGASLQERAKAYEGIAMESLAAIAMDDGQPAAARVSAAAAIIDRSAGKAVQQVVHDHRGEGLATMLGEMLERRRLMYEGGSPPVGWVEAEVVTEDDEAHI